MEYTYGISPRRDFEEKLPEAYKLLAREVSVPPVRTMVNLFDDYVVVRFWKPDAWEAEERRFAFDQNGVAEALYFLSERRLCSDALFASVHESEDMPARGRTMPSCRTSHLANEKLTETELGESANPSMKPKTQVLPRHRAHPHRWARRHQTNANRRWSRPWMACGVVKKPAAKVIEIVA